MLDYLSIAWVVGGGFNLQKNIGGHDMTKKEKFEINGQLFWITKGDDAQINNRMRSDGTTECVYTMPLYENENDDYHTHQAVWEIIENGEDEDVVDWDNAVIKKL